MSAYIELCRDNLVDKTESFGFARNIDVESGIRMDTSIENPIRGCTTI